MAGTANWRHLYSMTYGVDPEGQFVEPYVASFIFFGINMSAGIVLRAITAALVPAPLKGLMLSFLATMEACAYFYENNFVLKYYGQVWFAIAIIVQCFIMSRAGASENPVQALGSVAAGELSYLGAAVQILVQMGAGLASYRFAQLVWSLDLIEDHHERLYETMCHSDLAVTFVMGFLIELCACLVDTWLGKQTVASWGLLDELIKYTNAAVMICIGVSTTGMYFNPAMASGHTLGCQGCQHWEHFFVYWLGPFVGYAIALKLDTLLHFDVTKRAAEAEDKKTK